jgi:hypothetical protein
LGKIERQAPARNFRRILIESILARAYNWLQSFKTCFLENSQNPGIKPERQDNPIARERKYSASLRTANLSRKTLENESSLLEPRPARGVGQVCCFILPLGRGVGSGGFGPALFLYLMPFFLKGRMTCEDYGIKIVPRLFYCA